MWTRLSSCAVIGLYAAACGVSSSGYREVARAYEQTDDVHHRQLDDGAALFAGEDSLGLSALVAAVLQRNPTIEAARQGWRAALARYPRATALDDPSVAVNVAPLSFVSSDVKIGFGLSLSQRLPYPGKRRLRGEIVSAEAAARRDDYLAIRQRLPLIAARLYFDYYLIGKGLAVNAAHIELVTEYGETINLYLDAGRAWQDDALKIEVELVELRKARVTLEAERDVAVAQLNSLLHRRPELALPPPPSELEPPTPRVFDRAELARRALRARPELSGNRQRTRGAEAEVALASREFYPDFRVTGVYNRMWPMLEHQIMVGLGVDLPLRRHRRRAAVEVARARVARIEADRDELVDRVLLEVETALRRAEEADESVVLYRDRVLPAARARIDSVRAGLDAGRTGFIELIRAERELRTVELRYYTAIADAHRQRAELDWAVGATPGSGAHQGGAR